MTPSQTSLQEDPMRPGLRARRRGNALILVLVVAAMLIGAAVVTTLIVGRSSTVASEQARTARDFAHLEGAIELLRVELVGNYVNSGFAAPVWVAAVPLNQRRTYAPYPNAVAWVSERSPAIGAQWLRLRASTTDPNGLRQSIEQVVNFDRSSIFDLAVLCETADCMACHMKVRGDVGTLFDGFRPGHDMMFSGTGTKVDGNLYAANTVVRATGETPGDGKVNGAQFGQVFENSTSSKLPFEDGVIKFPRLKAASIIADITEDITNGNGGKIGDASIALGSAAEMYALPPETNFTRNTSTLTAAHAAGSTASQAQNYRVGEIPPVWDGNLVLVGTAANPIVLHGDVFVTGDVVIKGVVTGKGAIYAGRNAYVAGDITYKNKPQKMLDEMRDPSDPDFNDPSEASRQDITDGADELRLAARANIVLGDYAETAGGSPLPTKDKQPAEYFREQFGLTGNRPMTVFKPDPDGAGPLTSEPSVEVKEVIPGTDTPVATPGTGEYRPFDWRVEDGGSPIAATDVHAVDAYNNLRPTYVEDNSGVKNVKTWLSDDQYRDVLGTQQLSMNTYRGFVPRDPPGGSSIAPGSDLTSNNTISNERVALLQSQLGIPNDALPDGGMGLAQWIDRFYRTDSANLGEGARFSYDPTDVDGGDWDAGDYTNPLITVYKKGVFDSAGQLTGYTVRVLDERIKTYVKQPEVIDAFVYSNKRIAGMTQAGTNLSVTGGLISSEIGVLAPGRRAITDKSMDAWQGGDDPAEPGQGPLAKDSGRPAHYAWREQDALYGGFDSVPSTSGLGTTGATLNAVSNLGTNSQVRVQVTYNSAGVATYDVTITGRAVNQTVGTGYGTEVQSIWSPTATQNQGGFATAAAATAWASGQLAASVTARSAPNAPEVTQVRGSGGWNASSGSAHYNPPGTSATQSFTFDVNSYPGSGPIATEADIKAAVNAFMAGRTVTAVAVNNERKWRTGGFQDQLDGSNLVAPGLTERNAYVNRYRLGSIVLTNGVATNLRAAGDSVNAANGEKYGGMMVNYDFRMQNGGLGFDLVGDQVGRRLAWIPTGYQTPPP